MRTTIIRMHSSSCILLIAKFLSTNAILIFSFIGVSDIEYPRGGCEYNCLEQ